MFNNKHIFNLDNARCFNSFKEYSDDRKNRIPKRFKENIIKNGKVSNQISEEFLNALNNIYTKDIKKTGKKTGIYFYGLSGGGKTHNLWLMSLMLMSDRFQQDSVVFNTIRMIDTIYQSKINKDDAEYTIEDVRKYSGTLILDEFGEDFETSASLRVIKDIIDYSYSNKLFTTFASNFSMKEIAEKYDDRLSNRLQEMCDEIKVSKQD